MSSMIVRRYRNSICILYHQVTVQLVRISLRLASRHSRDRTQMIMERSGNPSYLHVTLTSLSYSHRISTEPYYELPLPVTKLRSIFHFRVGAHSLPVEQGRIEMPKVPRHLRRCTFCATNAIGDERHCVFDCPHFQGLRQQHAMIFRDSHEAMRSVMWHKDQKSVCALVLAIL